MHNFFFIFKPEEDEKESEREILQAIVLPISFVRQQGNKTNIDTCIDSKEQDIGRQIRLNESEENNCLNYIRLL